MEQHLRLLGHNGQPRATMPTNMRRVRRLCVNIEAKGSRKYPAACPFPYDPDDSFYYSSWTNNSYKEAGFDAALYAQLQEPGSKGMYGDCSEEQELHRIVHTLSLLKEQQMQHVQQQVQQQFLAYFEPISNMRLYADVDTTAGCLDNAQYDTTSTNSVEQEKQQGSCPDLEKLGRLTDMLCQTVEKLDRYMELQEEQLAERQPQLDLGAYLPQLSEFLNPSLPMDSLVKQGKTRGKRQVRVMPVQPLVLVSPAAVPAQPAASATQAATAPVAEKPPKAELSTSKPRLRMRKKRLPSGNSELKCKCEKHPATSKAEDSKNSEKQSAIPKEGESRRSRRVSIETSTDTTKRSSIAVDLPASGSSQKNEELTRDSGTTMWCPRPCCKYCCGSVTGNEEDYRSMHSSNTPSLMPVQLYTSPQQGSFVQQHGGVMPQPRPYSRESFNSHPPCPSTCRCGCCQYFPHSNYAQQGQFQQKNFGNARMNANPRQRFHSGYGNNYHVNFELERVRSGSVCCNYVEEQEEPVAQQVVEEPNSSEEWYDHARRRLAELERQELYFASLEQETEQEEPKLQEPQLQEQRQEQPQKQPQFTCDKLQQTDSCSTLSASECSNGPSAATRFIATSDKCTSTAIPLSGDREQTQMVHSCQTSAMKCSRLRRRLPASTAPPKVKFAQTQSEQVPVNRAAAIPRQQAGRFRVVKSMSELMDKSRPQSVQHLLSAVESSGDADAKSCSRFIKGNPFVQRIPFCSRGAKAPVGYPTNWTQQTQPEHSA